MGVFFYSKELPLNNFVILPRRHGEKDFFFTSCLCASVAKLLFIGQHQNGEVI